MPVPRQQIEIDPPDDTPATGVRARMHRLMVETASEMMRQGGSPTVSEVAERAGVSRSTAYRYFPTRDAMVQAVVGKALGPVLDWAPAPTDLETRLASLFQTSFPRLLEAESTFRAALRQSLEKADDIPTNRLRGRGHRIDLLGLAIAGTDRHSLEPTEQMLAQALSLAFGIESIVVLKDIWGLNDDRVQQVVLWAARAMAKAAREEMDATQPTGA